jgi:hypothetical protein
MIGVSSIALVDKPEKMQAMKTPKGLSKKKEKPGVGVQGERAWVLDGMGGALMLYRGGRKKAAKWPLKVPLRPRAFPYLLSIHLGGRTFISLFIPFTGSGQKR